MVLKIYISRRSPHEQATDVERFVFARSRFTSILIRDFSSFFVCVLDLLAQFFSKKEFTRFKIQAERDKVLYRVLG
jgi:hypothetical protein